MVTPHTATVFNYAGGTVFATVLKGVFLEESAGAGTEKEGAHSESAARLFIPFDVMAEDAFTGETRVYQPPKEYRAAEDKQSFWTLEAEGQNSGTENWFVKGLCAESCGYGQLRAKRGGVYRIVSVTARDYGSPALRHWEVRGV